MVFCVCWLYTFFWCMSFIFFVLYIQHFISTSLNVLLMDILLCIKICNLKIIYKKNVWFKHHIIYKKDLWFGNHIHIHLINTWTQNIIISPPMHDVKGKSPYLWHLCCHQYPVLSWWGNLYKIMYPYKLTIWYNITHSGSFIFKVKTYPTSHILHIFRFYHRRQLNVEISHHYWLIQSHV